MGPKTVLFPVDRSDETMNALSWGLNNVCRAGDKVLLLNVVQPASTFPITPDMSMAGLYTQINESNEQDGRALLSELAALAEKHEVTVEKRFFRGFPTDVIPMVADQDHCACIVIGSHPYGTVKRFFVGSVSDSIVHNCSCPIVVVKPPPLAPTAEAK